MGGARLVPSKQGEGGVFATKDHIEHIEHDGEMAWKKRRLTGDGSPYLGYGPVVGRPPWAWGLACVWDN